jgi:hypothetical protein
MTVRLQVSSTSSSSYAPRSAQAQSTPTYDPRKKVVVVGGGWAGFGAAKHLTEQGYAVTLLEAAKNPGGLSGGMWLQAKWWRCAWVYLPGLRGHCQCQPPARHHSVVLCRMPASATSYTYQLAAPGQLMSVQAWCKLGSQPVRTLASLNVCALFAGFRTSTGKVVEAGMKGFCKCGSNC